MSKSEDGLLREYKITEKDIEYRLETFLAVEIENIHLDYCFLTERLRNLLLSSALSNLSERIKLSEFYL